MNIKIFYRCSLFPSWSGYELISTPVHPGKKHPVTPMETVPVHQHSQAAMMQQKGKTVI